MRRAMIWAAMTMALALLAPGLAAAQEATPAASAGTPITAPGRIIGLSPDGQAVAVLEGDTPTLCVYDVPAMTKRACADLAAKRIHARIDDIVWSPDSAKIAIAENAFQTLYDGDLWLMDAATGALTDLTDDHYQGGVFPFGSDKDKLQGKTVYVDVLPAWSPDGRTIAFSRTTFVNGEPQGNALATIPAAGGPVTIVAKLSLTEPGVLYYGLAWAPDARSLLFSYMGVSRDDPQNGIWRLSLAGGAPERLLSADPDLGRPAIIAVNAAGTTGLVIYLDAAQTFAVPKGVYWLLNLASGARTEIAAPPDAPDGAFIGGATFSPDGTKLLVILKNGDGGDQLVARDLATGADETLLTAPRLMRAGIVDHGPDWATDGAILTLTGITDGLLLHQETAPPTTIPAATPASAATSTPAAAITPAASPVAGIAPGAAVVTTRAVKLRVAPSANAAAVASLPAGASLLVLGEFRSDGAAVWWPVEDPTTHVIGWANAADLDAGS